MLKNLFKMKNKLRIEVSQPNIQSLKSKKLNLLIHNKYLLVKIHRIHILRKLYHLKSSRLIICFCSNSRITISVSSLLKANS
ncbi:superfamily II DNA/RNA helicase [Catalinimonas alkaloidigena]|nr:superfamily II DNA/RNA helicase [Catalinimonas alkaloidigena]